MYETIYREKLMTKEEAAALVKDGDEIEIGFGANFPMEFDAALAERAHELNHVAIRNGVLVDSSRLVAVGGPCLWQSWHGTGDVRRAMDKGTANHIPVRYSEIIRYVT